MMKAKREGAAASRPNLCEFYLAPQIPSHFHCVVKASPEALFGTKVTL